MNYKTSKKGQRGQALILIAFAAVGLFAFSALAIDGSRAFSNKRQAQNAADTSVLTAALTYIRTPGNSDVKSAAAEQKALDRSISNGFDPDNPGVKTEVKVYINLCSQENTIDPETGWLIAPCDGLPTGAVKSEYIRVRIVSTIPTTFGRVIGRQTLTSAAEAIARVQGSSTSSTGGFSSGAAMVAINDQKSGVCFRMNGGAYVYTHNSGIFINCDSTDAIFMNTNMELRMDANGQVVGCYNTSSGNKNDPAYDHDPIDCDANGGESVSYSAADFADVPTMPSPVPTCSGTALKSGNKYINGGNVPSSIIDTNTEFSAGVYCFDSDLNVQNHSTVTGTGLVVFVMKNGKTVNLQSGETFNFE
ncbi:MAG TPA: pilus assembly protein TadG-related protein, partial [Anaerolineales bacterium]|nr:pilus assembly protein TadG-related protein [Anaerolineales bacterium]